MRRSGFLRAVPLAVGCAILVACGESTAPTISHSVGVDTLLAEVGSAQTFGAAAFALAGGVST